MKSFLVAIALVTLTGVAWAAPVCTAWMPQPDGSSWRSCVADDGTRYCESCKDNQCSRVTCQ